MVRWKIFKQKCEISLLASKPESTFIRGVHAHLKDVYFEKMNNPFRSGTADVWYSGLRGDLWVEYKYIPKIPKVAQIVPDLSERQKIWLRERSIEFRQVRVIVGCPEGGVIYRNGEWIQGSSPSDFRARLLSRSALAAEIREITGISPCRIPAPSLPQQKLQQQATGLSRPS